VQNCDRPTIANYLYTYFDLHGVDDEVYVCGDKKRETVTEGRLTVSFNKKLQFDSPLDILFSQLLSGFKARYAVLAKEVKATPAISPLESETPAPSNDNGPLLDEMDLMDSDADDSESDGFSDDNEELEVSPQTRDLAEQVSTHEHVVRAFLKAYVSDGWHGARVEDNIPDWWASQEQAILAVTKTSVASNKRRKVGPPPPDVA
ncbi:hypothetical protein DICSQDRAFT_175952, partial [Dichomitus squalens LYAD-421 SS1]